MPLNIQLRKIPYIIAWGSSKGIQLIKIQSFTFQSYPFSLKENWDWIHQFSDICLQNKASNKKKDKWKNHRYNNFLIEVFELLVEIKENVSSTKRTLHYTKFVCRLASWLYLMNGLKSSV